MTDIEKDKKRCLHGLESVGEELKGCSLAIGNFDGVHLGHRKIIQTARGLAERGSAPVVALTFEPPPEQVLRPRDLPLRVLPHGRKCCALLEAGADVVVTATTTKEMLAMPAKEFVERIISQRFAALHVVEGRDFRFGSARSGDVSLLNLMGCHYGFAVHVVEPVLIDLAEGPTRISSTLIRKLVAAGDVENAARCLGRPFALYGNVIAGEGVGRQMDFPTANIAAGEQVVPADGVYAARAGVEGRMYAAAVSVGRKPTFGQRDDRFIEAYLLDAHGDFYGREMELAFLRRLRGQEKFSDTDSLRAQIARDVTAVREICR